MMPMHFTMTAADCATAMHRRRFLRTLLAGAAGAGLAFQPQSGFADDVVWLEEVQTPPRDFPREAAGRLDPLLVTADGKPIRTRAEWERRRREVRDAWLEFLGPMPESRPEVRLNVLDEERVEGCFRQLVEYECEKEERVQAWLLRPEPLDRSVRRPGLVGLHGTSADTIDIIAGRKGDESRHLGLKLCRRGFVVCCPRNFLWNNVKTYQEAVEKFRARHPGTLGMHKMLYDAMRGVDVLASLPEVDAERIGAVGHSLGAKETLYLAAFDERVKAGVASEGGLGFRFTNWNAPWYLGERIHEPDFALNHHQLVALIAPRPFLVLAGESGPGAADGDRSWPFLEAARPVYELYGRPVRLGMDNHGQGHSIPPRAFERTAEWLGAYL